MTPTQTKPFDSYFGGKEGSGTYQTIINQIPPHKLYLEPFAGNGAIFRNKLPADCNILVDRDKEVVEAWKEQGLTERHMQGDCGKGNHIVLADAIRLLIHRRTMLDLEQTFIYLDPPYPLSSIKSNRAVYKHTLTDAEHYELLFQLKQFRNARIAISSYPNKIYDMSLSSWRVMEFQSQTQRGRATELLYMNYDPPAQLHDYRYVGEDYRERERIAKKVKRAVKKFEQLPELERNALLAALNQHRQK